MISIRKTKKCGFQNQYLSKTWSNTRNNYVIVRTYFTPKLTTGAASTTLGKV
jgi:hypothetical protein